MAEAALIEARSGNAAGALAALDTAPEVAVVADAAPDFDAAVRAAMQEVERAEAARAGPRPR